MLVLSILALKTLYPLMDFSFTSFEAVFLDLRINIKLRRSKEETRKLKVTKPVRRRKIEENGPIRNICSGKKFFDAARDSVTRRFIFANSRKSRLAQLPRSPEGAPRRKSKENRWSEREARGSRGAMKLLING